MRGEGSVGIGRRTGALISLSVSVPIVFLFRKAGPKPVKPVASKVEAGGRYLYER